MEARSATVDRSEVLACAVVESRLGALRVEGTRRGVRRVGWVGPGTPAAGADRSGRIDDPGERVLAWALRLAQSLEPGAADAALPLDAVGTEFQRAVWTALRAIPRGATRTYGGIACALGCPGAARAVGRACAASPAALVVPCHRVRPAAGGLGDYAWGTDRKRALLALEGALDAPARARAGSGASRTGSSTSVHRWSAA